MEGEDLVGGGDHALGCGGVAEEVEDRGRELGGGLELEEGVGLDQFIDQKSEVFHVRAADDRFVCEQCFNGVLAACAGETFADHNYAGEGVPVFELASRIDQEDFGIGSDVEL